jgi:hypothetical protein
MEQNQADVQDPVNKLVEGMAELFPDIGELIIINLKY